MVLIIMITIAVFVSVFLNTVIYSNKVASEQFNSLRSLYLAEAGLNKAMWYLLYEAPDGTVDGSWRTTAYPTDPGPDPDDAQNESFDGGSYIIWVRDSAAGILVTAEGDYNGSSRTIQQEIVFDIGAPKTVTKVADTWREI